MDGTLRAQRSDGEKSTMGVGRRQPIPRAEIPTNREENRSALDARRFGARPEGAQGPLLIKRVLKGGPPSDTRGPSERSIFQSKNRGPIGDGRASKPGYKGAGGSRVSRNSDASESRLRQRGAKSGSGQGRRSDRKEEPWTHEEQQYLQDQESKSQKVLEYTPMEFGRETLAGTWPATASDELGTSEMFRERLLLARKYLARDFISWGSREQKADVMALVEKLKAVREPKPTDGDEEKLKESTLVSENGNQQVQALMEKFLGGNYEKFNHGRGEPLSHVERYAHRNDSYYPPDEKALMEKVRSLLPNRKPDKGGGKNEVDA